MRFCALIALLLTAPLCAAQSLVLELREEAQVGGVYFTVGDIARVQADDVALAERVRAQRVGRAPRIGQTLGVTQIEVGTRVARAFPQMRDELTWQGPRLVRVRGAGQTLLPEDYMPTAESFLNEWLGERYPGYALESLASRTPVSLPFGEVDVTARLPASAATRKRMSVWLDFSVEGQHYRSLPVWFAVEASGPGFIAAANLAAGAAPTSDLVRSATVVITDNCDSLADANQLDGDHRLQRPVLAGQALCAENLEQLPAVARGAELLVTASSGPVVVSTVATALEDGEPGQIIDVRRNRRGVRFAVEVTGMNQARVIGDHDE